MIHHIYLSAGMFGFTRLASYDYFAHVERAVGARFPKAGQIAETHVSLWAAHRVGASAGGPARRAD